MSAEALGRSDRDALESLFREAQERGAVGPGTITPHIDHALAFAGAVDSIPGSVADLGSGAGLPGLVLALRWPTTEVRLIESMRRRASFLVEAVERLGCRGRVVVDDRRVEVVGHDAACRETFDLVVARSFGPPAVTAECGAPLLAVGGHLVTSEPPDGPDRWPEDGLALVGLSGVGIRVVDGVRLHVSQKRVPSGPRAPRRVGVPVKRPLF